MSEPAPVIDLNAPPIPLAGPLERSLAQVMFVGGCISVVPASLLTAYSLILIYAVFPVVITGLLNWWGWWLLLNHRRRGWDRPVKSQPRFVWLMTLIFHGLPLMVALPFVARLTFDVGPRPDEIPKLFGGVVYLVWLLFGTLAGFLAHRELRRPNPPAVEVAA
ncbi:MAG: hypothetical protein JSR82_22935 [Verrucomicrobia bacterium]|nr:hypothetical protein [Verrucomicrobiota bacterium]